MECLEARGLGRPDQEAGARQRQAVEGEMPLKIEG